MVFVYWLHWFAVNITVRPTWIHRYKNLFPVWASALWALISMRGCISCRSDSFDELLVCLCYPCQKYFCGYLRFQEHADMIDQQCKADQEKFNKVRLLLVCLLLLVMYFIKERFLHYMHFCWTCCWNKNDLHCHFHIIHSEQQHN